MRIWKDPKLNIRQANRSDLDALYEISLKTGNAGADATALYSDPKLIGHIYSAPYLLFEPELAFVVEHRQTVAGFCVGTADTKKFSALLEAEWWPNLRRKFPRPQPAHPDTMSPDERRWQLIHDPKVPPSTVVDSYPAHVHLNLLPVVQGRQIGRLLLDHWLSHLAERGAQAIHIGSNRRNSRAIRFWNSRGFVTLASLDHSTTWMGKSLT